MAFGDVGLSHAKGHGVISQGWLDCRSYPVDWRTSGWSEVYKVQIDWMTGLNLTDTTAHEWLGLIAYRLTGKTDELFPSSQVAAGPSWVVR